jgi:hypothetical protein
VTGVIVVIGDMIWLPALFVLVRVSGYMSTLAERCVTCPRAGLALLAVGAWCGRLARGMLPPR